MTYICGMGKKIEKINIEVVLLNLIGLISGIATIVIIIDFCLRYN